MWINIQTTAGVMHLVKLHSPIRSLHRLCNLFYKIYMGIKAESPLMLGNYGEKKYPLHTKYLLMMMD